MSPILLMSQNSITATDSWRPEAADDPAALARALDFFAAAARPGSLHYLEFVLRAGQGLLLANDRISHGRLAYRDDGTSHRVLLRGLFSRRPSVAPHPVGAAHAS